MPITDFKGSTLLDTKTIEQIKQETKVILQKKDIASAWQAVSHIKTELTTVGNDAVQGVLPQYREITTQLKALALPLFTYEEVQSLLKNNVSFLRSEHEAVFIEGFSGWFASQDAATQQKAQTELGALIPNEHTLHERVAAILFPSPKPAKEEPAPQTTPKKTNVILDTNSISTDTVFNDDDAQEIAEHTKKVADTGTSKIPTDQATVVAEKIFETFGSGQDKEVFIRRAQALITSRLKDIRTELELHAYFERPSAVGGLGIASERVPEALALVQSAYTAVHEGTPREPKKVPQKVALDTPPTNTQETTQTQSTKVTEAVSEPKKEDTSPIKQTLPASVQASQTSPQKISVTQTPAEKKQEALAQDELNKLIDQSGADEPLLSVTPKPTQTIPVSSPHEKKQEKKPLIPQPPVQSKTIPVPVSKETPKSPVAMQPKQPQRIMRERSTQKPRMEDITQTQAQPKQRSVGMAGELGTMDLTDFRRYGTPEEGIHALLTKMSVLEQDSLVAKIDGIKQFRMSPIYRQYLAIGEASLGQGKKLSEVLSDTTVNPNTMTEDEFFAIAGLHSKLK